jgi:hypothetical protein
MDAQKQMRNFPGVPTDRTKVDAYRCGKFWSGSMVRGAVGGSHDGTGLLASPQVPVEGTS